MPPKAAAVRNARVRTPIERAVETLTSMGNQALCLASGRDACAWSPTEVNAASEAMDTLGAEVLHVLAEERLAGQVIMLGLALRRAAPSAPGITEGQRSAYASLHPKLTTALVHVGDGAASGGYSRDAPPEVCTALIKSHVLRAFCPLLAAATASLLPGPQPPQQPSRRSVQAALALAGQVCSVLGLMAETVQDFCSPEQRSSLTATLAKELAESGLLEHWARLVLALGTCEDGEDGAAKEAAQLGRHLEALAGHDCTSLRNLSRLDPWTELLLSGPCPCLAYLLSSHLVAFASELDRGPTYGLPSAAAEVQLSGPSSSSAQPPRLRPPVPLVDTAGFPLRPRKALGTHLAAPALCLWTGVLNAAGQACSSILYDLVRTPPHWKLGRRLHRAIERSVESTVEEYKDDPIPFDLSSRDTQQWRHVREVVATGLQRGGPLTHGPAAYQLGMRLARSMACSLDGCASPSYLVSADGSVNKSPWDALAATHDPAAWLDPALPPLQAAAAVGLVESRDVAFVAKLGLSLAREALEPARVLASMPGHAAASEELEKQLGAWWRAALAWAGLWSEMRSGTTLPALRWELLQELIEIRGLPGAPSSVDARLAMSAGFLPVLEALLRHPEGHGRVETHKPSNPFGCSMWDSTILGAGSLPVASFCATMAKLLNKTKLLASAMRRQQAPGKPQRWPVPRGLLNLATFGFKLSATCKTHVALAPGELFSGTPGGAAWPSDGAAGPSHAPAPASGGGGSSAAEAAPQLPLTAACVALNLLPSAAALACVLYDIVPDGVYESGTDCSEGLVSLLELLLAWVPPILLAAEPRDAASAGPSASPGAPVGLASSSPGCPTASAASSDSAEAWDRFLWEELGLAWVLGATASLLTRDPINYNAQLHLTSPLFDALWALVVRAPGRLVGMIAAADAVEEATEGAGGDTADVGPSLNLLQRALSTSMGLSEGVSNELLYVVKALRSSSTGGHMPEPDMEAIQGPTARFYRGATSLLASLGEAGQVLPRCSNPDCTSLAGPSEAAVKRMGCSGCMRARYCSQACQGAHWARGHAQECRAAARATETIDLSSG